MSNRKTLVAENLARYEDPANKSQICLDMVQRSGCNLEFVPDEFKTYELCLAAVKKDCYALEYVPENHKTKEICLEAIERRSDTLKYVPEELKTDELCDIATSKNDRAFTWTPVEYLFKKIEQHGSLHLLKDMPILITYELCLNAVKKSDDAFQYVPNEYKTVELCFEAGKHSNFANVSEYVPDDLVELFGRTKLQVDDTPESFFSRAIKNGSHILKYVPKELKTHELCFEAIMSDENGHGCGWTLEYVPENLKPAICLDVVKKNGGALNYVPEEFRTYELCLEAVAAEAYDSDYALNYVPNKHRTEELCLVAVKKAGWALEFVPEELKTYELCLEAVKNAGYSLKYVPEKHKTKESCLAAINNYGRAFEFVPENLKEEVAAEGQ